MTKRDITCRGQRLFHESMRIILKPLIDAGKNGMEVTGGDGCVRMVHPILTAYAADFPEQCLVACAKGGTCAKCRCPASQLQDPEPYDSRTPSWTLGVIADAKLEARSTGKKWAFHTSCMSNDVAGGAYVPFWKGFPHADIHQAMAPDVLHQLYQGVFKHLVGWCQDMMTEEELDRRIRSLPPYYHTRHFSNGISGLTQVSGREHKEISHVLLGCLVGAIPQQALITIRSLLDFIYLAQYTTHDDATLGYMRSALGLFHGNKHSLISLGIRSDFNIPKVHALIHYVDAIELLGTTDNYNTEMFERLHIDFAKEGWRASNKRDAFPQMTTWLTRRENVAMFESYISMGPVPSPIKAGVLKNTYGFGISIPKSPSSGNIPLHMIMQKHNCPGFQFQLKTFLDDLLPPNQKHKKRLLQGAYLPFTNVDIIHSFKLSSPGVGDEAVIVRDWVKAQPVTRNKKTKKLIPARFDTVIVLQSVDGESSGVHGKSQLDIQLFWRLKSLMVIWLSGTRVGRLRVIFRLPKKLQDKITDSPAEWPTTPLAYVEWYTKFPPAADPIHLMYSIRKPAPMANGFPPGDIIPLSLIRQSCQLFPHFTKHPVHSSCHTHNVLDSADKFLVNNWTSLHTYQTIW